MFHKWKTNRSIKLHFDEIRSACAFVKLQMMYEASATSSSSANGANLQIIGITSAVGNHLGLIKHYPDGNRIGICNLHQQIMLKIGILILQMMN